MRSILETIAPDDTASWVFLNRQLDEGIPFEWHHHPEYELTLTLNSRGHRYIGDDIQEYDDGDLVLIGPGIPHSWYSSEAIDQAKPHVALVIWFHSDWVKNLFASFPELRLLKDLLSTAAQGVEFSKETRHQVRPLVEAIPDSDHPKRLMLLLEILLILCRDVNSKPLANVPLEELQTIAANARIDRVLTYLHQHFAEPINIQTLADLAHLSLSGFHRMFRRHARITALEYIARLRIGRACSLLLNSDMHIAGIATKVGYGNLSLFNRQFAAARQMTPSAFRKQHRVRLKNPHLLKRNTNDPVQMK